MKTPAGFSFPETSVGRNMNYTKLTISPNSMFCFVFSSGEGTRAAKPRDLYLQNAKQLNLASAATLRNYGYS